MTTPTLPPQESKTQKAVTIRMYHPSGIGDCFLLSFPRDDGGMFNMLIDCGVLQGTDKSDQVMTSIVEDIAQQTGGCLDVLAVTHQHWDHISGFHYAEEVFRKQLRVQQIWFGWLENPNDQKAQDLAEKKRKILKSLDEAGTKLVGMAKHPSSERRAKAVLSILQRFNGQAGLGDGTLAAGNRITTQKIMEIARSLSITEPQYLKPGGSPIPLTGVAGARVYVFGPPTKYPFLFQSDPKSGQAYEPVQVVNEFTHFESAMAMTTADVQNLSTDEREAMERSLPFGRAAGIKLSAETDASRQTLPKFVRRYQDENKWQRIDDDWMWSVENFALKLDGDTNNTSLVLAIEIGSTGKVLLFAADAQMGNWLSWKDLAWSEKNAQGTPLKTSDLLKRVVLYKVGHHGSFNATLSEGGLEEMESGELVAMIPVNRAQAQEEEWEMPAPALFKALRNKTRGRVILADQGLPDPQEGCPTPPPDFQPKVLRRNEEIFCIEHVIPYD